MRNMIFCFDKPDYSFWLSKDGWTSKEAAILICGGNPSEVDWNKDIETNSGDSLAEEVEATILLYAGFKETLPPLDFIKIAKGLGIVLSPELNAYLTKQNCNPAVDIKSSIYKYYAFWAKMDTWTFVQVTHLLSMLDLNEKNVFMSPAYYPEREELAGEIGTVLRSSIAAGYFSNIPTSPANQALWNFTPVDVIQWAKKKGYQVPPLLLELMEGKGAICNSAASEAKGGYTTPYLELMKRAISENKITNEKQGNVESLKTWFLQEGMSKRLAGAMATIIRLPESQAGAGKKHKDG